MMNLYIWTQLEHDVIIQYLMQARQDDRKALQKAIALLLPFAEQTAITSEIIREYVLTRLLQYPSVFSKVCGTLINDQQIKSIWEFAKSDIEVIHDQLLSVDWNVLAEKHQLISLQSYQSSFARDDLDTAYNQSIVSIVQAKSSEQLLMSIHQHLCKFGTGELSRYRAFKWQNRTLHGLKDIDVVNMDELVGIDYQKEMLIDNTRAFLQGKPANHILLCGSMGSGKSSSVKALLSYFDEESLHVIEISKQDIPTLDQLLQIVGENPQCKYIFFLDDLTFEGNDENYGLLKTALDGQLLKNYGNVLYYATSNRRNLVRDTWAERTGDVHESDTLNERYSLSERFGIKLYFPSYDQNEYLQIIQSRLENEGLAMTDEIRQEALLWERMYHGRSGRTATNFVKNYLSKEKNK